ncbi:MAG: MFS transporter [Actinomycetota bacterium]
MTTTARIPLVMGVLFGLAAVGSSATAVVVPELGADLDLDTEGIAAVFVAYSIAFAATTAVFGRLGDLHGQRTPLVIGMVVMAIGSLVSAVAPDLLVLLVGRVAQGAGAGAIPALVPGVLSSRIPADDQPAALSSVAGVAGVLAALGPLLGGLSAAAVSWRLAVALPAAGLLLVPAIRAIALDQGDASSRLDRRGAALTAASASGLVLVLQAPGIGVAVGVVGAVLLVVGGTALVRHQRHEPDGFTPRAIVASPPFWLNAVVGATMAAVYLSILLAVPVRLAAEQSWSAVQIGAALVPAAAAGPVASALGKRLAERGIPSAVLAGVGVAVSGFGAIAAALIDSPVAQVAGFASALIGFGLAQPALIDRIARGTSPDRRGIAVGLFNLVFFLGGAIGSALVGSFGIDDGSLLVAGLAIASGALLARPHDTPYERCVRSTGTIAGAIHCLASPRSSGLSPGRGGG